MVDNGRIYQLVTVSVRSPLPVAWIAMGFELDHKAARELADITGLAVTLSVNSGGRWTNVRQHGAARGTARQSDIVTRRIEMSRLGQCRGRRRPVALAGGCARAVRAARPGCCS